MKKEKDNELFDNIIGYNDIKDTLKIIIDILNNQKKYMQLGSVIPHGLLLYGPPGVGKSSISNEFVNGTNRNSFIVRKTKSDGSFIEYLNDIFNKAKDKQPALILLDDLDKFSEDDKKNNNEEFVTIQSLIDDVRDKDIFIVATANEKNILPKSLLRAGRFDIQIRIDKPSEKDALEIFNHYLSNKKLSKDVDIKNITSIIKNSSCADLEKICNQAGIYAGYKNKKQIGMEELLKSSLEFAFGTNINDLNEDNEYVINTAYHEAGHALIGELLEPGSVSCVTVTRNNSEIKGITVYHNNDNYWEDIKFMKNRIKTLLAGKAATEIIYHTCDTGANSDIQRAFNIANRFVEKYCMFGFDSWVEDAMESSEKVKQAKDDKTIEILTRYYTEVKELLIKYRPVLDSLAYELKKKKILFQNEIEDIYNSQCKNMI